MIRFPTGRRGAALLLAGVTAASCTPPALADSCDFRSTPRVVVSEEGRLLQYWVEESRPVLRGFTLPESRPLIDFREQISASFDVDPRALLENQLQHTQGADTENVRRALAGDAGTIRSINCLEALLFSAQAERSVDQGTSMFSEPTEFLSYVLAKGDSLRIYFYTVDQPGIRGIGIFNELLERDRADDWSVEVSIHNHNFFPASAALLGGVVPSATDVQAFRGTGEWLDLPSATITNGFHSIEMSRADFDRFSPPGAS